MGDVEVALNHLTVALKEEQSCVNYHEALNVLKSEKELFARFNEFRKKNMELHMRESSLIEQSALRKEFEDLLKKEEISKFLYWEQQVTKLFRNVYEIIAESVDFDYSFLD